MLLTAVLVLLIVSPAAAEHTSSAPFECRACKRQFATQQAAARHDIKAHGAQGCSKCGILYKNAADGVNHQVFHHGGRTCGVCGRTFASNLATRAHLAVAHRITHCDKDDLDFTTSAEAAAHARKCAAFRRQRAVEERARTPDSGKVRTASTGGVSAR